MTKIQLQFRLTGPLDELLMGRIARAHAIYGIQHVQVASSLDALEVEYDASRLAEADVEAALHRAGIPVRRVA